MTNELTVKPWDLPDGVREALRTRIETESPWVRTASRNWAWEAQTVADGMLYVARANAAQYGSACGLWVGEEATWSLRAVSLQQLRALAAKLGAPAEVRAMLAHDLPPDFAAPTMDEGGAACD